MCNGWERFKKILLWGVILFVAGCATIETPEEPFIAKLPEPDQRGVYHRVQPGETIWRIAKTYDVAISDIIETNHIPNAAQVEENQLLFIPGADFVKQIVLEDKETRSEFVWPVKGKIIKYFHQRDGTWVNKGVDIQTQDGEMIRAARTGRVVFADYLVGYGQTVILDHMDGFFSVYGHNAQLQVKLGDLVFKNEVISQVGGSRRSSYLHFEIRKNSEEDNPLYYLP